MILNNLHEWKNGFITNINYVHHPVVAGIYKINTVPI